MSGRLYVRIHHHRGGDRKKKKKKTPKCLIEKEKEKNL